MYPHRSFKQSTYKAQVDSEVLKFCGRELVTNMLKNQFGMLGDIHKHKPF